MSAAARVGEAHALASTCGGRAQWCRACAERCFARLMHRQSLGSTSEAIYVCSVYVVTEKGRVYAAAVARWGLAEDARTRSGAYV